MSLNTTLIKLICTDAILLGVIVIAWNSFNQETKDGKIGDALAMLFLALGTLFVAMSLVYVWV